jgi:hypothetical protein
MTLEQVFKYGEIFVQNIVLASLVGTATMKIILPEASSSSRIL